jgi:hypothetical protein
MNLFFFGIRPFTWLLISLFYVFCAIYGGPPNEEVLSAALPLIAGIALAVGAGAAVYGAVKADKRQKEAFDLQRKLERQRRRAIRKTYGAEAKRAKQRLEDPDSYAVSDATEREMSGEIASAAQASAKTQLADIDRGFDMNPYLAGRRQALKANIAKGVAGATSEGRLGAVRLGEQIGAERRRADVATVLRAVD